MISFSSKYFSDEEAAPSSLEEVMRGESPFGADAHFRLTHTLQR